MISNCTTPNNAILTGYVQRDMDLFQMAVHRGIDANDRPSDDGSILELNGDFLAIQLL